MNFAFPPQAYWHGIFEDSKGAQNFLDPFTMLGPFSTALIGLVTVLDFSVAFTSVIKALAFGCFTSLSDFSSVGFKAWKDVIGLHAISASLATNSLKSG